MKLSLTLLATNNVQLSRPLEISRGRSVFFVFLSVQSMWSIITWGNLVLADRSSFLSLFIVHE